MQKVRAGIIGGAGYTGGELIRLLLNHPATELNYIHSRSNAGQPLYKVHQDLFEDTGLLFTDDIKQLNDGSLDVLFLCLGHGESKKFLAENNVPGSVKIIDLANDFRLKKDASYQLPVSGNQQQVTKKFVYGLPELNRDAIKSADNIANPGCFATAIQLGLLPLAKAGLLDDVYTTGITGSTGAGQSLSATSHFSWRANNIQAYKTLTHQHLGEIGESLLQLQPGKITDINFVPWRGDFTRGIFISSTIHCELSLAELQKLFIEFYKGHPFTHASTEPVFLKQVVNTNKAMIQLEKVGSKLVVHSAIDNLLKGASGQAVQNMNLLFGLDETTGLKLKATGF
ncbi:MAG: N-acetyl-gamma-glutamyl-phosphate reductase [Bacteroidetes bacterium]|nr:N-acetyl-gamma-glutamyl-phosphate reductase [Bacteroidota bacterium]